MSQLSARHRCGLMGHRGLARAWSRRAGGASFLLQGGDCARVLPMRVHRIAKQLKVTCMSAGAAARRSARSAACAHAGQYATPFGRPRNPRWLTCQLPRDLINVPNYSGGARADPQLLLRATTRCAARFRAGSDAVFLPTCIIHGYWISASWRILRPKRHMSASFVHCRFTRLLEAPHGRPCIMRAH